MITSKTNPIPSLDLLKKKKNIASKLWVTELNYGSSPKIEQKKSLIIKQSTWQVVR
jgi:hypothetical protein